jgi:hypothetical protein
MLSSTSQNKQLHVDLSLNGTREYASVQDEIAVASAFQRLLFKVEKRT